MIKTFTLMTLGVFLVLAASFSALMIVPKKGAILGYGKSPNAELKNLLEPKQDVAQQ